jgi:molybdopterin synthase sulfur carrier subunit
MAWVFIPPSLRPLTGGIDAVELEGATVGQLIDRLEDRFPGTRDRLCRGDELQPGIAVAVDGSVRALGLLQPVRSQAEVHFLPAVGGG